MSLFFYLFHRYLNIGLYYLSLNLILQINFQNYINRCKTEEQNTYRKWKQEIIDSGIEFSKDELKYHKLV